MTLRDNDLVAVYPYALGEHRILLLRAFGEARGRAGEELLTGEASAQGPATSDVRSVALGALGQRAGSRATEVFVRALSDRTVQVQVSAALGFAEYGNVTATAPFLSWMEKKLKRKNRLRSWDPREIPAPLLHAIRNESLEDFASTLHKHLDALADDEEIWLTRLGLHPADSSCSPNVDLVRTWLYRYVWSGPVDHQRVQELCEQLLRRNPLPD